MLSREAARRGRRSAQRRFQIHRAASQTIRTATSVRAAARRPPFSCTSSWSSTTSSPSTPDRSVVTDDARLDAGRGEVPPQEDRQSAGNALHSRLARRRRQGVRTRAAPRSAASSRTSSKASGTTPPELRYAALLWMGSRTGCCVSERKHFSKSSGAALMARARRFGAPAGQARDGPGGPRQRVAGQIKLSRPARYTATPRPGAKRQGSAMFQWQSVKRCVRRPSEIKAKNDRPPRFHKDCPR